MEDVGPTKDHEDEEDWWEGPLPAYMSGIVDNSPEAVERQRLHTERQKSEAIRTVQARELRERLFREHNMSRELFGRLRLQYGQMFIDSINAGIAAVWDEVKPVFSVALLSKSSEGRANAICGSFYNTGIVIGVPSRVKRFSTAARTCNSAT